MSLLRGLGTAICSILLFLALTVFSAAFLLNSTVLNTGFMNKQIDKIDISSIVRDTVEKEIKEELADNSDLVTGVVLNIVAIEEPFIKEQMHAGINEAYDYFLGKTDKLYINVSLAAIKNDLNNNAYQIIVDYLEQQLSGMSDADADEYAYGIAVQIPAADLPPELRALPETLRTTIIKEYIKSLGGKSTFNALMYGLNFLVEPQVKAGVEQYVATATADIEDNYIVDETTFDSSTLRTFRDIRAAIIFFKAWYVWLIIVMIILAGLIFLINWTNFRASMLALGIDLLVFGILDLAGILTVRFYKPQNIIINNTDVPASIQVWMTQLAGDITSVLLPLVIGIIGVGAILMTTSFFIKKPEAGAG